MKDRLVRHWPVLVLLFLPVVALWRCLLLGESIGPWDQILAMAPWHRPPMAGHAWDVLSADGVLQFHVWRDYVFQSWRSLTPPFWNSHQLMGTPVLANSQSGGFYPPHILAAFTFLPTSILLVLLAWAHLSWAGLGTRRLVLNLGGGEKGAVFAGVVFALSAFMIGWAPLPSVISTCAWIPWCLAWTVGIFRGPTPLKEAGKLAFGIGMMFLAGHLQFAFYGVLAVILVSIGFSVVQKRLRFGLLAAAGGVLGGLIAMPQLLPVLEYSKFSHRQGTATAEGYQAYSAGGLAPFELLGLSSPVVMGLPGQAAAVASDESMPQYWPAYVRRGAAFAEGALAVGPLVLALLLLLSRRHPRLRASAVGGSLAVFGILLALGTPLNALLYFGVPGWSATGSPGRAIVLVVLGLALAAGLLWPKEEDSPAPNRRVLAGVLAFFAAPVLLLQLWGANLASWIPNFNVAPFVPSAVAANLPALVLPVVLFLGGVWLMQKRPGPGFAMIVAAQALIAGPWILVSAPGSIAKGEDDPNRRLAFVEPGWGLLDRAPALMPPNTATLAGLNDVAGYDSLLHRDTVRLLNEINGRDSAPEANGNIMHIKRDADPEKLAAAGVTEIWTQRPEDGYEPASDLVPDQSGDLYRRAIGGQVVDGGVVKAVRANGFTVEAEGGPLLARYRLMPGWTASQSGKALAIQNGDFMAIDSVEPGEVEFKYTPPGLVPGLLLGLIGLAGMALFLKSSKAQTSSTFNAEQDVMYNQRKDAVEDDQSERPND